VLFGLYVLSMILCHLVIRNGAKTSGKIIIVTASTPFVIFFILVVRGLFLDGALEGIIYLFKPKW
jgi:SNF family Na+-dependent transporter